MTTYNVHLFVPARVAVYDVEADSYEKAVALAQEQVDVDTLIRQGAAELDDGAGILYALVDVQGDEEFEKSRWFKPKGESYIPMGPYDEIDIRKPEPPSDVEFPYEIRLEMVSKAGGGRVSLTGGTTAFLVYASREEMDLAYGRMLEGKAPQPPFSLELAKKVVSACRRAGSFNPEVALRTGDFEMTRVEKAFMQKFLEWVSDDVVERAFNIDTAHVRYVEFLKTLP